MDDLGWLLGLGFTVIFIVLAICIALYVVCSLAYAKALRFMGYDKPWMAWIPFACNWALAECTDEDEVELLPNVIIPMSIFRLWWVLCFVLPLIPVVGTIVDMAYRIICSGWCFWKIYDRIDGGDNKVLGYLSGWLSIIAVVKFLMIKEDKY